MEIINYVNLTVIQDTRRNIKQTARDIYETLEILNHTRSVSLHQQITLPTSDSKALLNLTCRTEQRAIFRLRLLVRVYIQIRHKDQAVCPHCDEHFDIYTVHYISDCPASIVHQTKLLVDVPTNRYNAASMPLTMEILRRQGLYVLFILHIIINNVSDQIIKNAEGLAYT